MEAIWTAGDADYGMLDAGSCFDLWLDKECRG
jgi:hypothetical protein